MPAIPIRQDASAAGLRRLARRERDRRVALRLIAIANALEGMSREQAARQAGMDRQTLRDWVIRYNAEGVEGLRDRPRSGRPCRLTEGQRAALKALVLRGPEARRDGALAAWRLKDLSAVVAERYGARYGLSGLWRLLQGLDLAHLTARPIHPAADPVAQAAFKNTGRLG